ncbi:hypothetical protein [Vagococcus fluvialis]|uniref:hypothetical protein n=1 Tax=Vagococcus fluvialis TaxID=2738 RepID=UPI003B5A414A
MTELFVKIPSSALAIGSDKKLTVEEINLFAWLQTMINWLDFRKKHYHISCDLNLLVKVLGLNKNNLSRGKNKVMENLISLKEKGYLSFEETEYKTLEIKLHIKQDDVKAKPNFANKEMKYAGFIKIPISSLNKVKTKYDITIVALVVLRSGIENYQITRSEWQEVLDVSVKTAVDVVNKCDLVETIIGKYVSENRQEANTYILKENSNTETLQDEFVIDNNLKKAKSNKKSKKTEETPITNMHRQITDPKVVDDFETFEKLVDFNKKMDSEAYLVYLESDDSKLIELTDRKIERMKNSEQARKKLEQIISGAHSIRHNQKIKKERETFGTRVYFEAELKMYTELIMAGEITDAEYMEMESYIRAQLNNLVNDIKPIQFKEWQKNVDITEPKKVAEVFSGDEDLMSQEVKEISINDEEDDTDFDVASLKDESEDSDFDEVSLKDKDEYFEFDEVSLKDEDEYFEFDEVSLKDESEDSEFDEVSLKDKDEYFEFDEVSLKDKDEYFEFDEVSLKDEDEYFEFDEVSLKDESEHFEFDVVSLKDESYDTDFDISLLKRRVKEESKEDIMFDNMLKKITDKRVMYNKELLKEIQDFKTEMSLYAYEIYMTTDDGQLRLYGKAKLENNVEMYQNLDRKYRQKHKKKKLEMAL